MTRGMGLPKKWGFSSSTWNDTSMRIRNSSLDNSRSYQDESGWGPRRVSRGLLFLKSVANEVSGLQVLHFETKEGPDLTHWSLLT